MCLAGDLPPLGGPSSLDKSSLSLEIDFLSVGRSTWVKCQPKFMEKSSNSPTKSMRGHTSTTVYFCRKWSDALIRHRPSMQSSFCCAGYNALTNLEQLLRSTLGRVFCSKSYSTFFKNFILMGSSNGIALFPSLSKLSILESRSEVLIIAQIIQVFQHILHKASGSLLVLS